MKVTFASLCLFLGFIVMMSYPVMAQDSELPRSPLLYGISSFIVPGLGQVLQGSPEKAIIHFGIALAIPLTGSLIAFASPVSGLVVAITGVVSAGWGLVSAMDAYQMVVEYNESQTISDSHSTPYLE